MHIKLKSSLIKFLSLMICLLSIMFIPTAFAGETNIEGEHSGGASLTGIVGGWNDLRSGYRMYIVNQSNTAKSPVLDVWFTDDFYVDGTQIGSNTTRAASGLASYSGWILASNLLEGDIPQPWVNGQSNASALDGWLLEVKDGADCNNAERAIRQVFGDNVLDDFYANAGEDPYYLVIEPLANCAVYAPYNETKVNGVWKNRLSGYYFKGTFWNWCYWCQHYFGWETGGVPLKSRTNETFALAIHLEKNKWTDNLWGDLVVPSQLSGTITSSMGLAEGYGIAMYRISDATMNGEIKTYDTAEGSPGKPENPKTDGQKGIYTIIKVYATEKKDGTRTYDGCYTRRQVCKNISILDEPEYTVEEWFTDSRIWKKDAPFGTTWPSILNYGIQKGGGSGYVTMDYDKGDRTLYILLIRPEEEEEEEIVLELQESEISRYYALSQVTAWKKGYNKGLWALPSLSTVSSCPKETSHKHDHDGHCKITYCKSTTGHLNDTSLVFKVRNTEENAYKNILATKDNSFSLIFYFILSYHISNYIPF